METTQEHEDKIVYLAKEVVEIFGVSMAASILERTALKVGAIGMTDINLFTIVVGTYVIARTYQWVKKW